MELSTHSCEENRSVKLNDKNTQCKMILIVVQLHVDKQTQNETF